MKRIAVLLLCLMALLSACSDGGDEISVVASMFPQYSLAREIAGENAEVDMLLDIGADAHSYDPTPADIMKIANADLFIYTGDEMELWAAALLGSDDIAARIESGKLHVLDLSEHATLLPVHEHDGHDEYDSHIWTSSENAKAMCNAIADALVSLDADNAEVYRGGLKNCLDSLDGIKDGFAALASEAKRDTVYFGGSFAFRYMFDEIGLHHKSVYEGCASHAEPAAVVIADMVEEIKASGARYVIYDVPSEKKIADAIAAECGIEVLHLHAIHNITKEEFDSGESYFSLMQRNIETLRKALS